jgi:CheY-like chemotaxis protein
LAALAEPSAEIIPTSPTILYVDDVESHRYSIRRLLSRHGFLVIEAPNGDEALHKFTAKPDLVLLDINLPDFNGFEVCRRLRMVDKKHVPIVHLTSNYRNGEGKRQSQAFSADEYTERPIEANALAGRLRQILQSCYLKESWAVLSRCRAYSPVRTLSPPSSEKCQPGIVEQESSEWIDFGVPEAQADEALQELYPPRDLSQISVGAIYARGLKMEIRFEHRDEYRGPATFHLPNGEILNVQVRLWNRIQITGQSAIGTPTREDKISMEGEVTSRLDWSNFSRLAMAERLKLQFGSFQGNAIFTSGSNPVFKIWNLQVIE